MVSISQDTLNAPVITPAKLGCGYENGWHNWTMPRNFIVIPYFCKIKFKPYEKRPYPQVHLAD